MQFRNMRISEKCFQVYRWCDQPVAVGCIEVAQLELKLLFVLMSSMSISSLSGPSEMVGNVRTLEYF